MPAVREAVKDFFGMSPLVNFDPDKVVAIGAGIQAEVLVGNHSSDEGLLLDVIPLSLGLESGATFDLCDRSRVQINGVSLS